MWSANVPLLARFDECVPTLQRHTQTVPTSVIFRPADTLDELKAAAHLVYRAYLKRKYIKPNPNQLKLSIFHALPDTTTFIALHSDCGLLGTLTTIQDSPLGLPMDEAYKPELDTLRRQGRSLAEVSMLSFESRVGQSHHPGLRTLPFAQLHLTLQLFKTMFDYITSDTAVTDLVACFNPRHQALYEFLHLQPLGGLKPYSLVNGKPAVAASLNIAETGRLAATYPILQFFYQTPRSVTPSTQKLPLSFEALHELFIRSSSIFASASPSELAYIASCYPSYPFQELLPDLFSPSVLELSA